MPSPVVVYLGTAAANTVVGWACSSLLSPSQAFCKVVPPLLDTVQEAASLALKVQLVGTGLGYIANGWQGLRLAARLPQLPVQARRLAGGGVQFYRPARTLLQQSVQIAKKALPKIVSLYFGYSMVDFEGIAESARRLANTTALFPRKEIGQSD